MTIHFAAIPVIMIAVGIAGVIIAWIGGLASWGYEFLFMFFVVLFFASLIAVTLGVGMQIGAWAGVR